MIYFWRAHSQSMSLCTLPLFQYISIRCLQTGVGTCTTFHAFLYQILIHMSHYMHGACNTTCHSFYETRLRRYTRFHNRKTTITKNEKLYRSSTKFILASLCDKIGTLVRSEIQKRCFNLSNGYFTVWDSMRCSVDRSSRSHDLLYWDVSFIWLGRVLSCHLELGLFHLEIF